MLEHVLSEGLEERIAAKLGEPTYDPHGDPIPGADGTVVELDTVALDALEPRRPRTVRPRLRQRPEAASRARRAGDPPRRRLEDRAPDGVRAGSTMHRLRPAARPVDARGGRPRERDAVSCAARDLLGRVLPGEAATIRAAQEALDGHRTGLRALWPFLGPAFIASVAYVDPGNFATDVAGGAKYGYLLLWAVLAANLMAMLVQTLSAKLGIATGRNLAEVCRDNFSRRVSFGLWLQAEVIAMATDLAEVLGAALGPQPAVRDPARLGRGDRGRRRVHDPCAPGVRLPAARGGDRGLRRRDRRRVRLRAAPVTPDPGKMADDLFSPSFDGEALLIAVGIIGATVMPHVIYLHSALTQSRVRGKTERELKRIQRFERIDVLIAMSIAGLVNLSMLSIFAARFFGTDADSIEDAYHGLYADPGRWAAVLLGIALLASGLSSSSVGTLAGQIVMQGFIRRQIPLFARRAITAAPALIVAFLGVDADARAGAQPGRALVRHPLRAGPARALHEQPPGDGRPRQQPADDGRRVGDRGRDQLAERVPAGRDLRLRDASTYGWIEAGSTTSKSEPFTRPSVWRSSFDQPGSGAPLTYQFEPLSATIIP